MLCVLSSCTHNDPSKDDREEKLGAFARGEVAVVIGDCRYLYQEPFILGKYYSPQSCVMSWKRGDGESFDIDGYKDIVFVKPGNYEFETFRAKRTSIFRFCTLYNFETERIERSKY